MLTAKDGDLDEAEALDAGDDDHITVVASAVDLGDLILEEGNA
jgi:hypothetical protein